MLWGVAYVSVELINVNDNEPAFNQTSYNFTYDEEIPVNFAIRTVTVGFLQLLTEYRLSYADWGWLCPFYTYHLSSSLSIPVSIVLRTQMSTSKYRVSA